MNSREHILKRIRQVTASEGSKLSVEEEFQMLTSSPSPIVQPALEENLVETFIREAESRDASVHQLSSLDDFPEWLSKKTESLVQATQLILAPEFRQVFTELPPFDLSTQVRQENSWGLCRGIIGIAETGTIVSNTQICPSGMLFLVERLLVIINRDDIVAYLEDAWLKLRKDYSQQPRTINLITGPSRTADVEQCIQLGAHGPRWTDYLIIG